MVGATASNGALGQHPRDRLEAAQLTFEQAVARFVARPQLRCNLERLKVAAVTLHDEGLANLEHCLGREPGSFGGRMAGGTPETHGDTELKSGRCSLRDMEAASP